MNDLIRSIKNLQNSELKEKVKTRIKEFNEMGKESKNTIFKELCFCLMTANFDAVRAIKIQNDIGDGFIKLSLEDLASKLKKCGHRFPNARAKYIYEARKHLGDIKLERSWLVKNIKGLGFKESSHFLRNIGYENYAILDFHIIDILTEHKMIESPKTLTPKKYIEIEEILRNLANKLKISLSEIDLYLWYLETGKILK